MRRRNSAPVERISLREVALGGCTERTDSEESRGPVQRPVLPPQRAPRIFWPETAEIPMNSYGTKAHAQRNPKATAAEALKHQMEPRLREMPFIPPSHGCGQRILRQSPAPGPGDPILPYLHSVWSTFGSEFLRALDAFVPQ